MSLLFVLRILLPAIPDLFLTLGYLIAPFSKVDFTDLHGPLVKFLGRFVIPRSLAGITQNQKSDGDIGMVLAQRPLLHGQGLEPIFVWGPSIFQGNQLPAKYWPKSHIGHCPSNYPHTSPPAYTNRWVLGG